MTVLVMAVAGSAGALARYVISGVVQNRSRTTMPIGTAAVNLLGAFLLGVIVGIGGDSLWWVAAAGVTGGLTTFSTWMVETVGLGLAPRPTLRAVANLCALAIMGVAMAALGYYTTN